MTRHLFLLLAALGAGGCNVFPDDCTADLQARVIPAATTMTVGQRVTARAEYRGCGGRKRLDDRFTWSSENPAVARVDSISGEIVAIASGRTTVAPVGERYRRSPARVEVEVR